MKELLAMYIEALQGHRAAFWNDIREAIYREMMKGS